MQWASRWKGVWVLPVAAQRPLSLAVVSLPSSVQHLQVVKVICRLQGHGKRSALICHLPIVPARMFCAKMGPWYDLTGIATLSKTFSLEHVFAMTYHRTLLHKLHSSGVFVFLLIVSSRHAVEWQSVKKCVGTDVILRWLIIGSATYII